MRYRAVVSYFGLRYAGWQRQKNALSVQQVLEEALEKLFGSPTQTVASGRTDAGVHAEGQVVHFDAQTAIPVDKIPFAVNALLPDDVSMLYCEQTDEQFNARFSAKRKTYCYKLYTCPHRRPTLEMTHEHIKVALDVNNMRRAASMLEGEHDFKCFEASGSKQHGTVRTIYKIDIVEQPLPPIQSLQEGEQMGKEICIFVCGNGFLYNMVRIIAGTLTYVGMGKLDCEDIPKILQSKDRKQAGKTLAAKGLHLISVEY